MMRRSVHLAWAVGSIGALLLAAAPASAAPAGEGWRPLGAGDGRHAWFIAPVEAPTLGAPGAVQQLGRLHHMTLGGPWGAVGIMRAHPIMEPPAIMTAFGGRLALIYQPEVTDGVSSHPVRTLRTLSRPGPGGVTVTMFDPPDRFAVEQPLVTPGRLIAAADTALGLAALTRDDDGAALRLLTRDGWTDLLLPAGAVGEFVGVRALGVGLGLLERDPDGARLWTLPGPDRAWSSSPIHADALDAGAVALPTGFVVPRRDGDALALSLVRGERLLPLTDVKTAAPDAALARLGDDAAIFWTEGDNAEHLSVAVVSGVTGDVLYEGPARFGPPLTPSDLRLVGFLLSAVMLGVLLFLLKPETPAQASAPPGFVTADLTRRALAAAIDMALAAGISAAVFGVAVIDAVDPSHLVLLDGADSWPVLVTSALYLAHGTLGEALAARTIGKALTGCRVASTRGPRVRLWQALTRNLVKVLVPPLVVLVLVDPNRRHTGDLIGGTIVVMRAEGEPAAANDGDASDDAAQDEDHDSEPKTGA